MPSCSDIGIARKQRVFAIEEDTCGTLKFPGASNLIQPAGNAVMNQSPEFVNSEELNNSLDVLNQFQNALPPGSWSVPMYARPSGTIGNVPQGDIIIESLLGLKNAATTASLSANIDASATTLTFDTLAGGRMPEKGIIQIGSELIYYSTKSMANESATSGTLTGLTRGYNSTSAASGATNASVTLKSVFYRPYTDSPTFSLWIETDHFVQGMSGCTANNLSMNVSNEGAVMMTFSGEGMQMVWAGSDVTTAAAATAATCIYVVDADRFYAGARIYNYTKSDDNSDAGYTISATNATTNKVTISTGLTTNWASSDVVRGYLPTGTAIGSPIESRHTNVYFNAVSAQFKSSDMTFNCPKNYITDEVGTSYPESFVADMREISMGLSVYFRKADAKYFSEGYRSNENAVELVFGNTAGSKMVVYMKRAKLTVPDVTFSAPTVELSMNLTALGTEGEDSVELRFE